MDGTNGTKQATEEGKIFVGGLSWETTKESLKAHFDQFGTVIESVVMIDNATKRPRGFGFVTFADAASVREVMEYCSKKPGNHHIVDNKQVDPKPACVKGGSTDTSCTTKIFVGGISHDSTDESVHTYFSQYGIVQDVDLKVDKGTSRKRGFAFVTFESDEAVEKVIQIHFHQLNGKTVECKRAQPRNLTGPKGQQQQPYGGTAPYGGYGQQQQQHPREYYGGGYYHQQTQQPYGQPPPPQPAQPYGNYMNHHGYAAQTAATAGYPPMGRGGDMHTPHPPAPPQAGVHQGHVPAGYGRGHDTTGSYHGGAGAAAVPQVGYGQSTGAAGAGAYGGGQSGYGYDAMQQVAAQAPPHATATPFQHTGYSDTTGTNPTAYTTVGAAAPPPQHKQQKPTYGQYY